MANPFPFVSGATLLAAELNGIGEAWTSYTPVINGGATTVTATLNYAKFARVNKIVCVQVRATVTSAGAANGAISISLPTGLDVLDPSFNRCIGEFFVQDTGVGFFVGAAIGIGVSTVSGLAQNSVDSMGVSAPTMTLANGDVLSMSVCYEVA